MHNFQAAGGNRLLLSRRGALERCLPTARVLSNSFVGGVFANSEDPHTVMPRHRSRAGGPAVVATKKRRAERG